MIDRTKIALVKVAQKQTGMEEVDYRALLLRVAGVRSATELNETTFTAVMAEFARLGFESTANKERRLETQEEYIRLSLEWVDFLADNAAERMAKGFYDRRTGVTSGGREGITKVGRFLSQGRAPANPLSHIIGTDQHNQSTIDPLCLVLFLREPIKEALRTHVLDYVVWPFDNVTTDVEAARKEVAAIDAELKILGGELSDLVALGESFGATV